MTYRWLTDLDAALTAAGIPYTEVPASGADPTGASSWRTRGRPGSTGEFNPQGVLCHHTASPAGTSDKSELNVILAGNSEAPGPISQLFIGRTAIVYLVAAGRANHAGRASIATYQGGACTDGNARLVGIEVGNNGSGEWWPDAQVDMYAAVVRALCEHYGWGVAADVFTHSVTGPPCGNYKIDPAGPCSWWPQGGTWDLEAWRTYITSETDTIAPPLPEDDMADPCPILIQASGTDGTFPGAVYVTDGRFVSIRWVADTYQLGDIQYYLRAAGQDDSITAVDRIASYGALVGPPATAPTRSAEPGDA